MDIVIAIDSFKGSLSSLEAGESAREGILRACPDARTHVLPLADGGEGTVDALMTALDGELITVEVSGPLGSPVSAVYGMKDDMAVKVTSVMSDSVRPHRRQPTRVPRP